MTLLRELREREGITQVEAAQRANITRSLYSLIELGIAKPSIAVAFALAKSFDTTVDELFSDLAPSSESLSG